MICVVIPAKLLINYPRVNNNIPAKWIDELIQQVIERVIAVYEC